MELHLHNKYNKLLFSIETYMIDFVFQEALKMKPILSFTCHLSVITYRRHNSIECNFIF